MCGLCAAVLAPLQGYLVGTLSASSQHPVHDALDAVSLRSWFNSPWTSTLEADIYKSTNMVLGFTQVRRRAQELFFEPQVCRVCVGGGGATDGLAQSGACACAWLCKAARQSGGVGPVILTQTMCNVVWDAMSRHCPWPT